MLDYRERYSDLVETFQNALQGHQASVWTALPGIIEAVDLTKLTASVQPAVQAVSVAPDNSRTNVSLPILTDVPIIFPRGGGYTMTFPIQQGDECLLVFSSRCIDNWWQQGGVQSQFELRMHDLSDGFAIVGPFSQAQVLSGVSTTTTQLRSNDGSLFAELDTPNSRGRLVIGATTAILDDKAGTVNLKAANNITLDTPVVNITGVVNVQNSKGGSGHVGTFNGTVIATQDFISNTVSGHGHVHSNAGGTGDSGPPVP